MLPAPSLIKLEKVRTATLGKRAPFLGDRLECMCGQPRRHRRAGSHPRADIEPSETRISNDSRLTASPSLRRTQTESLAAKRQGGIGRETSLTCAQGHNPKGKNWPRRNGKIRAGRVDRRRGSGGRERRSGL